MGLIFLLKAPLDLSATLQCGFNNKSSIFKFIGTKTVSPVFPLSRVSPPLVPLFG